MFSVNALQVSSLQAGKVLTPAQKKFNTLLRQIERSRQALAAWNESIVAYRQAHAEVLRPLQSEWQAGHRCWAFALDEALARKGWTRAEHEALREFVCEAAGELLDGASVEDPELEALFARHAEVDFATRQRERMLAMKAMAEKMTGLDLGVDEGIGSEADLFQRLQQGFQAQESEQEAEREATTTRRRKTAAQQRREAEAQQATQSVRDIYRKLASALHPDREPDPQQREAKTALMKRVNQAYESNDLLALLELQLQIEQIDADHIADAGDQRVKHYNKVLTEQLAGIKAEVESIEIAFRMEFGFAPGVGLDPARLGQLLEQTKRELCADLEIQQQELRMLGDAAAVKRWLKRQRQQRREDEFDFSPF